MAESERSAVLFTNSLYNKLKFVALVFLPALATLCLTIGGIWDIEYTGQVVGSITAVDTFLGVVLKISTKKYYKKGTNFDGEVIVTPEDGGNKVTMAFNGPPEDLVDEPGKHTLEFQVRRMKDPA